MPSLATKSLELVFDLVKKIDLVDKERELPLITDEPKFPSFVTFPSLTASKKYFTDNIYGQGFDKDEIFAKIKSIGECLERLCLFNPQTKKLVKSKFKSKKDFIDPSLFFCYSEEQVINREEFLRKIKEDTYLWYPAKDLITNKAVFLPAQLIFLSNNFHNELPIRKEKISTGAAFGLKESKRAVKAGFFEVIERDSCVPAYLAKNRINRIINLPLEIR